MIQQTTDFTLEKKFDLNKVLAASDAGAIKFASHVTFGKDSGGVAKIASGSAEISIAFEKEYTSAPIVTASQLWDIDQSTLDVMGQLGTFILPKQKYIVAGVTTKGFTILLESSASAELKFGWTAAGIKN
ncbi:MAG: hypothetical protein UT58_C0018G0014 [Microgenomates group bacterium GW2011_GWC1_39_7b]|nr:MAG: hypothetical protein UT58_C0018G0014 [Microgenomates group bacterium GW2011_GWC1_39_7b]